MGYAEKVLVILKLMPYGLKRMAPPRILVVDDSPDLLVILAHTLRGAGYHTVTAPSGKDALRELAAQPFALVLTDLSMPEMSGVELIEHIRGDQQLRHLPIVVITGFGSGPLATAATAAGANAIICKPFQRQQLLREVQQWIAPSPVPSAQPAMGGGTEEGAEPGQW